MIPGKSDLILAQKKGGGYLTIPPYTPFIFIG